MNAYVLTTVARLKAFIGMTGTTYDSVFEVIIDSVTDFIENECDRRFKKTAYIGTIVDGRGSSELVLPQFPVVSGETFTLYHRNSGTYGGNTWTVVSSNDYRKDEEAGIVNANGAFYKGFQNYKVLFTAGYDFENVTDPLKTLASVGLSDLEMIVWKLCNRAFNDRKSSGNISRMKLYNYDVTFSKEAYSDDEIKEVLSKYKRFVV